MLTNQWVKESYFDEYDNVWYHDWYYATSNGTLATNSWIKFQGNGKWYFVDFYGQMVHSGPKMVNGQLYYFNDDGTLLDK